MKSLSSIKPYERCEDSQLIIDTIHISTQYFDTENIIEKPWDHLKYEHQKQPATNLVYPTGDFYDIKRECRIRLWKNRLSFEFSIPYFVNRSNIIPITQKELKSVFLDLIALSQKLGISFSIDTLRINRIDLFYDIRLPFSPSTAIAQLMNLTQIDRLSIYYEHNAHNKSYLRWQNKNHQFVIYDKTNKLASQGIEYPHKLLRFEYRLMKKLKCESFGFFTITDLYDPIKQLNVFKSIIIKLLKYKPNKNDELTLRIDFLQGLENTVKTKKASTIPIYIAGFLCGKQILDQFRNKHGIELFLKSQEIERHKRKTIMKQFDMMFTFTPKQHLPEPDIWDYITSTLKVIDYRIVCIGRKNNEKA